MLKKPNEVIVFDRIVGLDTVPPIKSSRQDFVDDPADEVGRSDRRIG